jgi:hypothetical protein
MPHLLKPLRKQIPLKLNSFSCEKHIKKRGRKRSRVSNAYNMNELIKNYVLPAWKWYLKVKSEMDGPLDSVPRSDTVWKKILRDVREFFRILFRVRFHPLEYKSAQGASV